MNKEIDQAAMSHTTVKRSVAASPVSGRLSYTIDENGTLQIQVTSSSVSYTPDQLQEFGEMIQILQEESRLFKDGSILVDQLLKM